MKFTDKHLIKSTKGLQIGNFVRRSHSPYWNWNAKGQIIQLAVDELMSISAFDGLDEDSEQAKRIDEFATYEYLELDDQFLRELGLDTSSQDTVFIMYNDMAHMFQLQRISPYEGVTDQNSAEIELAIANGTRKVSYIFGGGASIDYAHQLQNLYFLITGKDLVRQEVSEQAPTTSGEHPTPVEE